MLLIIYPILHRSVSPLTLLTHLLHFLSLSHTNGTEMRPSHGIHLPAPTEVNLTSQQAACKNIKPTPSAKPPPPPKSLFLTGFGLNQNIQRLCGRSAVRSADKQNVQFQPRPSQEEALCDERAFYFESIRACALSAGWYHPHDYTCSLVERYLYPSPGVWPKHYWGRPGGYDCHQHLLGLEKQGLSQDRRSFVHHGNVRVMRVTWPCGLEARSLWNGFSHDCCFQHSARASAVNSPVLQNHAQP